MSEKDSWVAGGRGAGRARLPVAKKYEVFVQVVSNQATQGELAAKHGVHRTTIRQICTTAKDGALQALAASRPGKPGVSREAAELAAARQRITALEKTIAKQAMQLHLIEGKDAWD